MMAYQGQAPQKVLSTVHDTQAFVAANDDMIIVVFRGTKEGVDWVTNLVYSHRECPETWGVPASECFVHEASDTIDRFILMPCFFGNFLLTCALPSSYDIILLVLFDAGQLPPPLPFSKKPCVEYSLLQYVLWAQFALWSILVRLVFWRRDIRSVSTSAFKMCIAKQDAWIGCVCVDPSSESFEYATPQPVPVK